MKLALTPLDTLFFRDSSPFDMGASPQAGVGGSFPPFPPTVAGAIRAGLARGRGWPGHGRWSRELDPVIGDGPDDLGSLRLTGPFVLRDMLPLFPLPRHIACVERDGLLIPEAILHPGPANSRCDLGTVRLPMLPPVADGARFAAADDMWVGALGFQQILSGRLPDAGELVHATNLWAEEARVGIARNATTRTVSEGNLYSSRHIRLQPSVSIGVEYSGVPDDWESLAGDVIPLGGENRVVACEAWKSDVSFTPNDESAAHRTFALIALTPLLLDHDVFLGRASLPELAATVVCACAGRPLRIGGWDTLRRVPVALKNAVGLGSTLFCEADDAQQRRGRIDRGFVRLGRGTASGFGLCAVATTDDWRETA